MDAQECAAEGMDAVKRNRRERVGQPARRPEAVRLDGG